MTYDEAAQRFHAPCNDLKRTVGEIERDLGRSYEVIGLRDRMLNSRVDEIQRMIAFMINKGIYTEYLQGHH